MYHLNRSRTLKIKYLAVKRQEKEEKMIRDNEVYCDGCHLKIPRDKSTEIIEVPTEQNNTLHYHNNPECLKFKLMAYSKNGRNWQVISRIPEKEEKTDSQTSQAEPLAKTDPIQIPCDVCYKPIMLGENFVSLRKEFGGNYKGYRIYNYHPACLSKEADAKIYRHSDADRDWYVFFGAKSAKK